MSDFDYINHHYGVNARIGLRVLVYGKPGTIVQDCGHYLGVNFDADKPGVVKTAHPTSEVVYLDKMVAPRKPSRSAKRYQDYLRADVAESFAEWLGIRRTPW